MCGKHRTVYSGLPADDRAAVEELYLSGRIHILCSTSTLAHGVNLPAHLVIIKVFMHFIINLSSAIFLKDLIL